MKVLKIFLLTFFVAFSGSYAQTMSPLQYYTPNDQTGLNQFEAPKTTDVEFDGMRVRVGGANTLQFQALSQSGASDDLNDLGSNFNLATSNLDIDVQLDEGLRMHLRTYLSSRHHAEAWVKGGYMQVDRLDFIQEGLFSNAMDKLRFKVGHMQNNYGDNHFRRTDNGAAIHNPFVGNYIMDSFTTEVGGEVYYFNEGMLAMFGLTNGKLNQSAVETDISAKPSIVGKLGYDSQVNEDLRVRLTGSIYRSPESPYMYLYTGDRAGSRYYDVMEGSFRSGRFSPGFGNEVTAIMINPFVKYQGLEFYGVFENSTGKSVDEPDTRTFNQYAAEVLYRFGADENIYVGGRYNLVSGELASGEDVDISRINLGGGWFMTENVLAKLEYVNQQYNDFSTGPLVDADFSGMMLEAVISF